MPRAEHDAFTKAWSLLIEGRFHAHIGLTTSGSSGAMGQLILLGKDAFLSNARSVNERLASDARDVWMKALPDFHTGGLGILARAHLSGATVVESSVDKWNARRFYDELEAKQVTLLSLVPTQLFDLVQLGVRAPKFLRAVILGGARLGEELRTQAIALGWPALPSYGMTECCSQIATALSPEDPRLRLLSHAQVRIGAGEHIEVRSSALLTAKIVFKGDEPHLVDPKKEGWLRAEDRGFIEADGSLKILGRSADFVKIGGEGVVVSRLEERLEGVKLQLKESNDTAILAAADARLGAAIVLLTTASETRAKELVDLFNRDVKPFERIRSVHHLNEIPRSPLGKLLRVRALAAVGLEAASLDASTAGSNAVGLKAGADI
jgi:O-succinylbenzoic acid--CoA ligase